MLIGTSPRMGDILVSQNVISDEQLKEALDLQRASGQRLGTILMSNEWATEEQITRARGVQMDVPYVNVTHEAVDPFVVSMVPYELAHQGSLLPLSLDMREGEALERLRVAMIDPWDVEAIDRVQRATRRRIEPLLASEGGLLAALERAYHAQKDTDSNDDINDTIAQAAMSGPSASVEVEEMDVNEAMRQGDQAPVIRLVNTLFSEAVRRRASDIHIEPRKHDFQIRYRIDGHLQVINTVPRSLLAAMTSRIKIMGDMDISEKRLPLDGRISLRIEGKGVDFRVSTLPTQYGERVVMRILDRSAACLTLPQLGFSPGNQGTFDKLIHKPHGIILVTGPTGSGKTTTLYAALNALKSPTTNIITCEDPVEYELEGISQSAVNDRAGLTPGCCLGGRDTRSGNRRDCLPRRADRPPGAVHIALQRGGGCPKPPAGHGRAAVFDRVHIDWRCRAEAGAALVPALPPRDCAGHRVAGFVPRDGGADPACDALV